ncbi:Flagellar basal body rod protein FlgB [Maioricimonas rarisocia]|uniref:Flagellar basal body rod protein FlgB n=2 Tax=Maioricimonas rarisocia TaxID=2528026 RepID=A0A517ZCN6_9PLAN|nr:Flagellar basal body rod protein FlgB [Maioricimonas rarisocia]
MDVAQLRHRVISHNLANVNTPGYRRLDVEFEGELARQLARSSDGDIQSVQPQVVAEEGLQERADGNNVDVDREMGQLNKNATLFQTYSQLLATHFSSMRRAMEGP